MKKVYFLLLLICLMGYSTVSLASKIVRPWRSTTEIVKAGQSFVVWFDADNGQALNSVVLKNSYKSINCTKSVVTGNWVYDQMSGNRYDTRITVNVPMGTPADRYDLVLNTSSGEVISHGAVKVVTEFKSDYYIMHISDGHIYQPGYDTTVLFARKTAMVDIANIMDCQIIIETGDNMYNVRNHSDREVKYFRGRDSEGVKGMSDASAATFLVPGDHDGLNGNDWVQGTEQQNADFFNDYWGLQNSCFKYGKGRFMMLNNAWDVSLSSAKNHQYQINEAISWLQGNGSGGNFFVTAGHCYDKMHEFIDAHEPLDLVLAGDKHHVRTSNPWEFETGRPKVAYIAGSIRDHFEFNLFKVDESTGSYAAVPGVTSVANVLYSGNQDTPSTWVKNLSLSYSNANNGSSASNTATIVNRYNFPIDGAKVRFVMPKGYSYSLTNATIEQQFEGDEYYIVDATLDVPASDNVTVGITGTTSGGGAETSGDIGSILCWHYKEIYGGHDYEYNQSILKKNFPTDVTHWSDNLEWWENLVEEVEYSGMDYVALLSRGNQPNAPDRGNGNPKHIPKLIDAMQQRGVDNSFKIAIFDDVPNSWTGSKNWNESGGTYYSTTDPKFDCSDPNNYKYIWDYNLKQVFQHVPDEMRYKIDGRPVIFFWNLKSTWFTNIEGNLKPILDYIRAQCQSEFGFNPFLIVQTSWFDSDPQLSKSDVDAVHGWFSSAGGTSWTLVEENNYKIGVAVPGLRGPHEADHLDPAMGTNDNGTRLKYGLDNTVGAGARTTLIEGFTNAAEAAAVWRSNDQGQSIFYDYHNQRLNIVRSYTNNPYPDTLKVEAEACDLNYDLTLENTGGAYLYLGDLDVLKCSDTKGGWYVTNTQAGEWMEWKELPLLADTRFELRYKSTAASSVRISIDGNDLQTASLPSTSGAWSTVDIGAKSFTTNGLHTVRLTVVSGSPDINYFNRTPGVSGTPLVSLQAEDANYSGALVATNHAGYNGTGFIEYVDNSNAYIEWTVDAPEMGDYDLGFRYALPNTGRPLQLKVNGVEKIASFEFPGTGDWAIWDMLSVTQTLNQGINTIRLTTTGFNGANIDELAVYYDNIPVTGVTLSSFSATLELIDHYQLTANVEPLDATNQRVSWSSSNEEVATVDSSGLVTAVSAGSATITVTTEDGNITATCDITVTSDILILTLQAEDASYSGAVFANNQAGYNGTGFIDYVNASNDYIEWTVNAPAQGSYDLKFRYALANGVRPLQLKVNGVEMIASCDFPGTGDWANWGTVSTSQILNAGNNTIRLTAIGSSGGNIDELAVYQQNVSVTGVTMSPTSAILAVSATQQLTTTVEPSNATNQTVSWTSSNSEVASVNSNGLVTAISAGSATITATTQDGNKTAISAITVVVPVTGVTLSPTTASLVVSASQQLTVAVEPLNATNQSVSWSSSNNGVAIVSSSGLVTAISAGSAIITVTTDDGNETATSAIMVSSSSSTQTLQAEEANYSGAIFADNQTGYNGTGFVDFVNLSNDYIEWTVNLPSAGNYDLTFRYGQGKENRPLQLKVNGVEKIASMDFPTTGDWANWATLTTTQTLNSGNNTIRLTAIGSSGGNFDELTVQPEAIYLDECDDLTGWTTHSGNSLSISSDVQQGSGSLQMTGSGTNEFRKAFPATFNSGATAANGVLDFWYYVSDVSLMGTNQVELGSAGINDVNEYNWSLSGLSNGWNHIVLNISDANIMGTPDLGAINWFRLYVSKTGTVTSKIDAIRVYADLNKSATISQSLTVGHKNTQVFPNPARDFVRITSINEIVEVSVYSIIGELQMRQVYESGKEIELNVSHLKPGVYLLIINNETHKLIIK